MEQQQQTERMDYLKFSKIHGLGPESAIRLMLPTGGSRTVFPDGASTDGQQYWGPGEGLPNLRIRQLYFRESVSRADEDLQKFKAFHPPSVNRLDEEDVTKTKMALMLKLEKAKKTLKQINNEIDRLEPKTNEPQTRYAAPIIYRPQP